MIIQAKHYSRSGYPQLKSNCRSEAEKVRSLAPKRYILATSVSLTPHRKTELQSIFDGVPIAPGDIWGREDLDALLDSNAEIVRRHFKLWLSSSLVLDQILKSGLYERSSAELETIRKLVPRFVQHGGVKAAEDILDGDGTLVICGPPGIGKTTLARILLWLHAKQGWQIKVIDSIDDAFGALSNKDKQLIFFDDFLGQVRVTEDLIRGTDHRLPPFLERIKNGEHLRFVLTTRDYILQQARRQSQRLDNIAVGEPMFILDVSDYSRRSRAEILFNHIYFSDLSSEQIDGLIGDEFYLTIIDHDNFNPRLIDQLTQSDYLDSVQDPVRSIVRRVLDRPEILWRHPYRNHFTTSAQALMIAVAVGGNYTSVNRLRELFLQICEAINHQIPLHQRRSEFDISLQELEGSAVSIRDRAVKFANPGVRDFMNSVILDDAIMAPILASKLLTTELKTLWSISEPSTRSDAAPLSDWNLALSRAFENQSECSPGDIDFVLQLVEVFGSAQPLYNLIQLATEKLELAEDTEFDVTVYCSIFRRMQGLNLPRNIESRLVSALARDAQHRISDDYTELTIQQAQLYMDKVGEHRLATPEMAETAHDAATKAIDMLEAEIDVLSTVDDLEELRDAAERLAWTIGVAGCPQEEAFDNKLLEIETEQEDDTELYTPLGTDYETRSSAGTLLSEETYIRSMFNQLK